MAFLNVELKINLYNDVNDNNAPLVNIPSIDRKVKNSAVLGEQFASYPIAASGNLIVNVNSLAPTRLYLYSSATSINVNMNGLGNILMSAGEPAYLPATITSLVITNTSSSTATNVEVGLIKI